MNRVQLEISLGLIFILISSGVKFLKWIIATEKV